FADPASTGEWRSDLARELGAEATTLQLNWSSIETASGSYTGPQSALLPIVRSMYQQEGFQVNLTISPLAQTYLLLPADLAAGLTSGALRWSDAQMIDRFNRLLDFVHASLPDGLTSLQIGHEVDLYLSQRSDTQFWADFAVFFQAARDHAKSLWGLDLKVGITSTYAGLMSDPA